MSQLDLNMVPLSRLVRIFSAQLSHPWIAQSTTSLSGGYCYNAAISACEKGQGRSSKIKDLLEPILPGALF